MVVLLYYMKYEIIKISLNLVYTFSSHMNHSRQQCLYLKVICCFVVESFAFSLVTCIYSFNLVTIEQYCNLTEFELYMKT